jgi:transcriptional regulator with XRE-family HTH domain
MNTEKRDLVQELAEELGAQLRRLRLAKNWTQQAMAERASVSKIVVRHLEAGQGANVEGLLKVLKALGRTDWVRALAPQVTVSPMLALQAQSIAPRQRAYVKRQRRGV